MQEATYYEQKKFSNGPFSHSWSHNIISSLAFGIVDHPYETYNTLLSISQNLTSCTCTLRGTLAKQ